MSTPPSKAGVAFELSRDDGGFLRALNTDAWDLPLTVEGAERLVAVLAGLTPEDLFRRGPSGWSSVLPLTHVFTSDDSREAFEALRIHGVPHLLRFFDAGFAPESIDDTRLAELFMLLWPINGFDSEDAVPRIVALARRPLAHRAEGRDWWELFSGFHPGHPHGLRLAQALRDPLPPDPVGPAYLAFVNALARVGTLPTHPFDTSEGAERIRGWLESATAPRRDYLAAAHALTLLGGPEREGLLVAARAHRDPRVRIEADRVDARSGREDAVRRLVALCLDPRVSRRAATVLKSLGLGGRVPAAVDEPDFRALAEMAHWLAHPHEFDRPPDAVTLLDSRERFWPPTGDRLRLWLVGYHYDDPAFDGFGVVGSVTFSRTDRDAAGLSADDMYALHCCDELRILEDPRAPAEASVEAGRALLDALR